VASLLSGPEDPLILTLALTDALLKPVNTILRESAKMPFHTDIQAVFRAFGGRQKEFNWLLTDIEAYGVPALSLLRETSQSFLWLAGTELTLLLEEAEHSVQFIWGVLSGFRPEVDAEHQPLDIYPFANGNSALWQPDVQIQHPLAEVEIVCWDSGYTMLLSRDQDLTQRFRSYFPEAVDLDEYNCRLKP
jgi:hypothetical protein